MSEDKVYKDGDIVWVKLGNNWWPGEVTGPARHPEGLIKHLKRVPYCVVKFFNENTYEYVRSSKQIFPFQCAKQEEFIRKGYSLFNSGNSFMEKFPTDVEVAKKLTHRKEPSFIINDRPDSIVKAILGQPLIHTYDDCYDGPEYQEKRRSGDSVTRILNITQNRNDHALSNEMSKTQTSVTSTPSNDKMKSVANSATTNNSNYQCNLCDFSSVRLNVMILHRKMHSNRNSLESGKSTASKPNNAKSTSVGTPTTTIIKDTNEIQQNEIIEKDRNKSKTKINTNKPTARMPALLKETTTAITPKGKHNRLITLQTSTNKSKPTKKTAEKEKKKEDNAYAAILSDFCPSETEPSPTLEEKQSRRSLRNGKNIDEDAPGSVSAICIDLSETKTIQKIPKKREYSSLQLHNESFPQVMAAVTDSEPDVVCLGDKETATIGSSNKYSETSKRDAEDIRRMLLADWSDDDETPTDAIVLEESIAVENTESNECIFAAIKDLHTSVAAVTTSTPVFKPSSTSTGRIRNIPKKDRRDVVLQDFNSDLSIIQNDNVEHATKTVALDLDSSNSSIVEIIEDKQSATIITINDDEEQEVSKSQKCQTDLAANESKDSDSAVGFTNDKSASAATSTTTLSCFDFQEDEDEQDNTAATISHFKKKYLSGDKLQNLSSVPTDELKEDNVAKSRAELAEKDQRLVAEIETLLEQTQPPGADLLNVNSFEESMSVKDLPIKERGKRIFKSRNKSRVEDKNNAEVAAVATVETSLTQSVETIEEYKSNENSTSITEIVDTEKIINEPEPEPTTDVEVKMIPEQITLSNKKSLVEISSQEIIFSTNAEIPKFLENTHFSPNENKENEDLLETNKDCSEESIGEHNTSECQKQQMEEIKGLTSDGKDENIDSEKSTKSIVTEERDNNEISFCSSNQSLDKPSDQQLRPAKNSSEQENAVTIVHTQVTAEEDLEQESLIAKNLDACKEKFQETETINNNKKADTFSSHSFGFAEKEVNNDNAAETQSFRFSEDNLKSDLVTDSAIDTIDSKVADEVINNTLPDQKEPKALTLETTASTTITTERSDKDSSYKNQQQCLETVLKIRVKSPEQLFNQAFVTASQQEPELQPPVDINVDARLITTTPTDENSSMGASDTGAEFGSPTSMLSEERLPAFRFQSNHTPQQEIETAETELQVYSERDQENTNIATHKSPTADQIKDKFLKDKPKIHKHREQKIFQQRRFSMDLISLQAEPKSSKRQRLSVDDITTNQENNLEKPQERLKLLAISQNKTDEKVRPKSRHMKITPRRNVSELFKVHSPLEKNIQKNVQKSCSLESVEETVDDLVSITDEQHLKNDSNITPNQRNVNKPAHEVLKKITETEHQVDMDSKSNSNNTAISEVTVNNDLEICADKEELVNISRKQQQNGSNSKLMPTSPSVETLAEVEHKEELSPKVEVQTDTKLTRSPNKTTTPKIGHEEETSTNSESNKQNELKSSIFDDNISNIETNDTAITEDTSTYKSFITESPNVARNLDYIQHVEVDPPKIPIISEDIIDDIESNEPTPSIQGLLDNSKLNKDHESEKAFSPGIPPPTPQEREIVIESENLNQALDIRQDVLTNIEEEIDMTVFPLTPKDKENSNEFINQPLTPQEQEQHIKETHDLQETPEENKLIEEDIVSLTPLGKEFSDAPNDCPFISKAENHPSACEAMTEPLTTQQNPDMVTDLETKMAKENTDNDECENIIQIPSTPQARDLIIECEPLTPQGIIECDHNIPAQVTPEKEIIIESHMILAPPTPDKNIIVNENLRLEKKETLLREFQVMQPKENANSVDTPQESQTNILQTDADKAAEEFLIEFDSIVNHSHTAEEDVPSNAVEDAINAEDLINNIIEEVHEDQQIKLDVPAKCESSLQYEPITAYTVVAAKNSWNQIFKESFNRQLPPSKRRQTICFEISDTKEGVACKKQAFDFESVLPVNKTIKRTAERKLTLPAIDTKLTNSNQPHNIFAINHNQLTINKKLIPTAKRKLSIEDNITSFIIERPKQPQQPANSASGPPPLQRIRTLNRQGHTNSRASVDTLSEPPPLQSNDSLFNELFPLESSSPTPCIDITQKAEGGRVIHQQIISSPTVSTAPQNKITDAKISKNKQIGVDSRGNKYVIIKTPPTDIVVQPTLTSSTAAAVTASTNFGTTITIQPLARSTTEVIVTKPTTKSKHISITPTTSPRKQQLQQQQMKHISITVPAKSTLEVSNSLEGAAKIQPRARRKTSHAKAVAAAATANNNINSAKHRQAMEALSRRLSIASETPPLAKISRASSTNVVQTQISNNNNLTTLFGDTQISNIAQQQLIQLQQQQQQQQQQTQTTAPQLQPPIILNKNAHQQSVIQRKTRKIPHQQQQQKQHLQNQQFATAKSSHLQQQSHIQQQQQQQQQIQQQTVTQITSQQQSQQINALHPPPLHQIQAPTLPMQQQIVQQSDGILITTATTEDDNVIDSNTQLIALPTQPYPGYSETFLLCKVKGNTCKPVDNVPLYLNHQLNELVPVPLEALEGGHKPQQHQIEIKTSNASQHLLAGQTNEAHNSECNLQLANLNCSLVEGEISAGIVETDQQMHQHSQQQQTMEDCVIDETGASTSSNQINNFAGSQEVNTELVSNNGILLNIEGQQVLLDAATFAHLLANPDANTQLISDDGTEYVLTHEVLTALQMQQEQQQALELANAAAVEQQHHQQLDQSGSSDIIAVALAGSDLYDNDVLTIDTSQGMQLIDGDGSIVFPTHTGAITQQHLTPPAVVTNAVLDQSPIMSTLEVPSSIATSHKLQGNQLISVPSHHLATSSNAALGVGGRTNLEDSLAAIGVTTQSSSIPSSLGLPITVTNPNIASKVTSAGPLNEMLQFVSHRPATAAATAAAVAAAALAGESRIFTD